MTRYRFAEYLLDTGARELWCEGEPVHLQPKAFALLEALISRRPEALSRAELHELLWPGVHVSDASLTRVVSELRSVLGEDSRSRRLIRTVHGFGYAFEGALDEEEAETSRGMASRGFREGAGPPAPPGGKAAHVLLIGQRRVPLRAGENILGRDPASIVVLDSAEISRRHCLIRVDGEVALIEDLESKNGTFVRDEKICGPHELRLGDVIRLGPINLVYGDQLHGSTVTQIVR